LQALSELRTLDTYRVLSRDPDLHPDLLLLDSADRLAFRSMSQVATTERVRSLARTITAGAMSDYERAARLERYLLEHFPMTCAFSHSRAPETWPTICCLSARRATVHNSPLRWR